jgi:hypothetical protein
LLRRRNTPARRQIVVERGQQVNEHPPGWKTSGLAGRRVRVRSRWKTFGLKGGESTGQEDGTAETHRDGNVDGENELHTHERSTPLSKTDFTLMVGKVSALEAAGAGATCRSSWV